MSWDDIPRMLLVNRLDQLDGLDLKRYSTVWFGVEFCSRLFPSLDDVNQARDVALNAGVEFGLVTPYLPPGDFERVLRTIEAFAQAGGGLLMVNDWGVYRHALSFGNRARGEAASSIGQESSSGVFELVLGRVLNRQRTSPDFFKLMRRKERGMETGLPEGFWTYGRSAAVDNAWYANWLMRQGFKGATYNNAVQGLTGSLDGGSPRTSLKRYLHVPWVCVTTTRRCGYGNFGFQNDAVHVGKCAYQCKGYSHELAIEAFDVPLVVRGNTQFYFNDVLPEHGAEIFDALIEHPDIPW